MSILATTGTALPKISILFFYLRIFPKKSFKISVYITMAVTFAYMMIFDFMLIFQCRPISLAWTNWDHSVPGKCIFLPTIAWSSAAINLLLDIVTIGLPLPEIIALKLPVSQKVPLLGLFLLGFL